MRVNDVTFPKYERIRLIFYLCASVLSEANWPKYISNFFSLKLSIIIRYRLINLKNIPPVHTQYKKWCLFRECN